MMVRTIGVACYDSEIWSDMPASPSDRRKTMKFIKKFSQHEDGAVTVDWVVLTAAVVVLAGTVAAVLGSGDTGIINTLTTKITDALN